MDAKADALRGPAASSRLAKRPNIESSSGSRDDADVCPLFMERLPSDFAANSGLAAIASLLQDDDEQKEEEEDDEDDREILSRRKDAMSERTGGGKAVVARRRRKSNRHCPYSKTTTAERKEMGVAKKSVTTVGEAQLFLSLWKM